MPQSLNPREPLIEVLEELVPTHLHQAAWATCAGRGWYFGNSSNSEGHAKFWKMDLDDDPALQAIWENARARCEELAGKPLKVVRQYANGHTYGMGGEPHTDDYRPDTFTLLYYPNLEWKDSWEGETVFYDAAGEIDFAVKPRPNRAVFFDSNIMHNGRAPGRACRELRVTVAFKLEAAIDAPATVAQATVAMEPVIEVVAREGANVVYRVVVPQSVIDARVAEKLANLSKVLRLPGYKSGSIPLEVVAERYSAQARAEELRRVGAAVVERGLAAGSVASSCELLSGDVAGNLEMRIHATSLAELPMPDFSQLVVERLTMAGDDEGLLAAHLKTQVLDWLDAAFGFAIFPGLVEREAAKLAAAVEIAESECREIGERRLRLGWVIAEVARRNGLTAASGAALEESVVHWILKKAVVNSREIGLAEWTELVGGGND